ncbi:unnamed protein product [Arabis nemorensis]|uniref:Uncharacterized protein n=1 Tax=Arabis nemorensis TaxID=586526 RepID=A0A565CT03_9BRAS|nr:unnamed protein product [Arabis nemorensis]
MNSSKEDKFHHRNSRIQESLDLLSLLHSNRNEIVDHSLHVEFKRGRLVMSSFRADEASDSILRNVIAYEQCHAGLTPFTSNYIHFINFLITTDRDVEVLTDAGVLQNGMGRSSLVVEMVKNLKVGVDVADTSQYQVIATRLSAHYSSRRKRCWATLSRVNFSDLWTGTAACVAVFSYFGLWLGRWILSSKLTKASSNYIRSNRQKLVSNSSFWILYFRKRRTIVFFNTK